MRRLQRPLVRTLCSQKGRSFHPSSMASNLRKRAVVSSFICTPPQSPQGFTFALFKRSEYVSTYRGKWAVCSGSIDPTDLSPAAAAKREILEETKLSEHDISLLRRGKPFSLIDEKLQTEWTIYPFAWQLKDHAKPIEFDWEHTQYKFVRPEDLSTYDHVPQLEVGLQRVTVDPELERGLKILRDDHESGAQGLALKALWNLLDAARGTRLASLMTSEEYWRDLRWVAWHLAKNGRPSMGAAIQAGIFKTLDSVREAIIDAGGVAEISLSKLKEISESAISTRIAAGKHSLEPIARNLVQFVEDEVKVTKDGESAPSTITIVTLSASGTVTQGLKALIPTLTSKGMKVTLSVLESRPNFEGIAFVNTLLDCFNSNPDVLAKLKVTIVSDANVASVVKNAKFFLFGGDKVIPNGDVSNKIGSMTASIIAKAVNPSCKVVSLFETDKITGSGFGSEYLTIESNDEIELTSQWPSSYVDGLKKHKSSGAQLEVINEYFEWVPAKYIDQYISEQGLLSKDDITKLGADSENLEERIFGDL